jgi:GNAT superfamily N-acetyltransferase
MIAAHPLRTFAYSLTIRVVTTAFPSVVDLRERPEFASAVADRVWRAWWGPKGYALSFIEGLVQQNLDNDPIPLALVAHDRGTFLGTASVIASDLDGRPQYTPWVAAVWVDPEHRSNGVGAALVQAGADRAHMLGFNPAYLCALPSKHRFYERLGWRLVEAGVTEAGLAVFRSP